MMPWVVSIIVALAMLPILLMVAYCLGKSRGRELEPAGERADKVTQEE